MEPDPANRNPGKALQRLWREDPEAVTAAHDALRLARGEGEMEDDGSGRHGLRAERMRELHRPLSARSKPGLTVADVAAMMGLRKETVARLLEHHGYLELAPYGRDHQRRLVTAEAYAAGHGHNVNSSGSRSKRLDGAARSAPFAVFYPEHVASIVWTLGWDLIVASVAREVKKRGRLAMLLRDHAYLPDTQIGHLAEITVSGVEKARKRKTALTEVFVSVSA